MCATPQNRCGGQNQAPKLVREMGLSSVIATSPPAEPLVVDGVGARSCYTKASCAPAQVAVFLAIQRRLHVPTNHTTFVLPSSTPWVKERHLITDVVGETTG